MVVSFVDKEVVGWLDGWNDTRCWLVVSVLPWWRNLFTVAVVVAAVVVLVICCCCELGRVLVVLLVYLYDRLCCVVSGLL